MAEDVRSRVVRAFRELHREHPAKKITVKSLIERSGISRQTFYYYFEDIFDVIDLVNETGLQNALRKCAAATDARESIQIYLEDFMEYERLFPYAPGDLEPFIHKSASSFLEKLLPCYEDYKELSQKDASFLISAYAAVFTHVLLKLPHQKGPELDLLVQQIHTALRGSLRAFSKRL